MSSSTSSVAEYREAAAAHAPATPAGVARARRATILRRSILAADAVGLTAGFAIAADVERVGALEPTAAVLPILLAIWFAVAKLNHLYDRDATQLGLPLAHDAGTVVQGAATSVCIATGIVGPLSGLGHISGGSVFVLWLATTACLLASRGSTRLLVRRSSAYREPTLVVGRPEHANAILARINRHAEYALDVVGVVEPAPDGTLETLQEQANRLKISRLIIAPGVGLSERSLEGVRELQAMGVVLHTVPQLQETRPATAYLVGLEAIPLVTVGTVGRQRTARIAKRTIDVIVSGSLLVLLAPLFAYIAFRVRRDSDGPVFFRQQRVGMGMRTFTCLKFRTMRQGTSSDEHATYISRVMNGYTEPEAHGLFKLARAADVTHVGQWLRRTSLDELPQLINVLRGDMSLVGPRPCLDYEMEHFAPHHFARFSVPAGITGLWQVVARGHSSFLEALEMDVTYARTWSLGLDIRLIARTPVEILRLKKTC